MLKRILHPITIMAIGLVKSAIVGVLVGAITSIVVVGGALEVVLAAFLTILFLLPAMFLYHLGRVLKLKKRICDTLYFVGFLCVELFFGACIIFSYIQRPGDGSEGASVLFFYILTFAGIAVYFVEVIFRGLKSAKELGYKEVFEEFDWGNIYERIYRQSQSIFIGVIRSCIIAAIIILVAATGPGFTDLRFEPIYITKGLIYLTGLLPAIIFYHIARALKLKWQTCDMLYFVAFVVAEFFFLPSAMDVPLHSSNDLDYLPRYAMAVIALGYVAVYMTEIYFRNRAILKSYEQKK